MSNSKDGASYLGGRSTVVSAHLREYINVIKFKYMSFEKRRDDIWKAVEKEVGAQNKEKMFESFICEVVSVLLLEKKTKSRTKVFRTAIGLAEYGVFEEEDLKSLGGKGFKMFCEKLGAKQVPSTICDLLYQKYVKPERAKIEEVCNNFITECVKPGKLPELPNYQDSPSQQFVYDDLKAPQLLKKTGKHCSHPGLLFHGLSTLDKEQAAHCEFYQYIEENSSQGPTVIYATPNTDWVRSTFEYLCCNWGVYLVFRGSNEEFGSGDMNLLLGTLKSSRSGLKKCPNGNDAFNRSVVKELVACALYVRCAVLEMLRLHSGEQFKPYHWLLIQVYPQLFFDGLDIFNDLLKEVLKECAAAKTGMASFHSLLQTSKTENLRCFVDRTHVLLSELTDTYFFSSDKKNCKAAFSAFLGAFKAISLQVGTSTFSYPVMMGAISYSSVLEEGKRLKRAA
eukprot:CAMPEP_0184545316 /NCGR_PEP_ID=MMETSP0199_2-20130426/4227_1 /TAXON_ID=1112570 /ORGANISM="Thraustochytrium sp., Strain LLF1b" /LENGTH=451 /DNA_ID=CAMNT_0026939609 /DNA_START=103 /DNA_END=1458 /DNA_ORIENTATION=+